MILLMYYQNPETLMYIVPDNESLSSLQFQLFPVSQRRFDCLTKWIGDETMGKGRKAILRNITEVLLKGFQRYQQQSTQ